MGALCAQSNKKGLFIGIVGMDDKLGMEPVKAFEKFLMMNCRGCGALKSWSIDKICRREKMRADYLLYVHKDGEEYLGIQFLLKGILDIYYGEGRGRRKELGMFLFPSRWQFDGIQKSISYKKIKAGRFG